MRISLLLAITQEAIFNGTGWFFKTRWRVVLWVRVIDGLKREKFGVELTVNFDLRPKKAKNKFLPYQSLRQLFWQANLVRFFPDQVCFLGEEGKGAEFCVSCGFLNYHNNIQGADSRKTFWLREINLTDFIDREGPGGWSILFHPQKRFFRRYNPDLRAVRGNKGLTEKETSL